MAFVLPIVSAISTLTAAGSIAGALSTVGGFLSVAGGVLAGVGALTGKKDLVKLGALFTLGSAASGALGFGEASTGIGAAADTAGSGLQGAADAVQGATATGEGLQASTMVDSVKGFGDTAAFKAPVDYGLTSATNNGGGLMMQKAQQLAQSAAQPSSLAAAAGGPVGGAVAPADYGLSSLTQAAKPLPASAAGITQTDLQSVLNKGWQRAQDMLKNTGQFIKDNKELAQIGGQALSSMYGPQAEQFDYQRSLMEQARRNLNSPIRLSTQGG